MLHHIEKNISITCITVSAAHGYICSANIWDPISLYSLQHNEVYKINAFYAKSFKIFFFLMVTRLQCPIKALSVDYGNSYSNQWAFTMLETEVFKYNF